MASTSWQKCNTMSYVSMLVQVEMDSGLCRYVIRPDNGFCWLRDGDFTQPTFDAQALASRMETTASVVVAVGCPSHFSRPIHHEYAIYFTTTIQAQQPKHIQADFWRVPWSPGTAAHTKHTFCARVLSTGIEGCQRWQVNTRTYLPCSFQCVPPSQEGGTNWVNEW